MAKEEKLNDLERKMQVLPGFLSRNMFHLWFKQNSTQQYKEYSEMLLINLKAKGWEKLPGRPPGLSQISIFKFLH